MEKITKNFSMREVLYSNTAIRLGIDNKFENDMQDLNAKELIHWVLQPLRDYLNTPISINSFFRCKALNKAVGGVSTSQHTEGKAADFKCKDLDKAYKYIKDNLEFDQLIKYNTFIHVSFNGKNNRKQAWIK